MATNRLNSTQYPFESDSISPYQEQLKAAYHTQFSIPEYLQSSLSLYKRLNWSASYFLHLFYDNAGTYAAGTIRKYNNIHHITFCTGCSIGQIRTRLVANPDLQLVLSFRKHNKMPAVVLVDFLKAESILYSKLVLQGEYSDV